MAVSDQQVLPQHRAAVVRALLAALTDDRDLSRSEISDETRLNGGNVAGVIADLDCRKLLVPSESNRGTRGPSGKLYRFERDRGRVLALGFGREVVAAAATDLSGELIPGANHYSLLEGGSNSVDSDPTAALNRAVDEARKAMPNLSSEAFRSSGLVGVSVSLRAPLDRNGRPHSGFMDRWMSRDVKGELRRLLSLPDHVRVRVENDANLIALRELRVGAARGQKYALVLRWGSGLGAGIILDGELYRGPQGLAGEIGHIQTAGIDAAKELERDGECSRCGHQCVEHLVSSDALRILLKARFKVDCQDMDALIAHAREGTDKSREILEAAAHLIGHKLGPIVSALNLERVVVDFVGRPDAYPLIATELERGLRSRMVKGAADQMLVVPASSDATGAILGGARLVLEEALPDWASRLPSDPNGR